MILKRVSFVFLLPFALLLLTMGACTSSSSRSFELSGVVRDGADTTLYLSEILDAVRIVDSIRTDSEGRFSLNYEIRYDSILYRIGRGNEGVVFRADSGERVSLSFLLSNPSGSCRITGNKGNEALTQIQHATRKVEDSIERITQQCRSGEMSLSQGNEQIGLLVAAHKKHLSERFIYPNAASLEAYFVLLQTLNGTWEIFPIDFFQPEPVDLHSFGSIASAFEAFKPEHPYTKGVKNKALQLIKIERQRKGLSPNNLLEQAEVRDFPALRLIDNQGNEQNLEEIASQHSKVLLVFVSFAMEGMPDFIATLRQLYSRREYNETEVYMVSYDKDMSQWMQATRTLPWINVYDLQQSSVVPFNVTHLPQLYLLENGTMSRIERVQDAFR